MLGDHKARALAVVETVFKLVQLITAEDLQGALEKVTIGVDMALGKDVSVVLDPYTLKPNGRRGCCDTSPKTRHKAICQSKPPKPKQKTRKQVRQTAEDRLVKTNMRCSVCNTFFAYEGMLLEAQCPADSCQSSAVYSTKE